MSEMTFPGERNRKRIAISNGKHGEPETLSRRAATFFEQVEDLQKERDQFRHALDTANARIEQFESNENRLVSEIEAERTSEAKADAENARTEQVRLETVIASIVNMGNDALPV